MQSLRDMWTPKGIAAFFSANAHEVPEMLSDPSKSREHMLMQMLAVCINLLLYSRRNNAKFCSQGKKKKMITIRFETSLPFSGWSESETIN